MSLQLTNLVGFGAGGKVDTSDWANWDGTNDGSSVSTVPINTSQISKAANVALSETTAVLVSATSGNTVNIRGVTRTGTTIALATNVQITTTGVSIEEIGVTAIDDERFALVVAHSTPAGAAIYIGQFSGGSVSMSGASVLSTDTGTPNCAVCRVDDDKVVAFYSKPAAQIAGARVINVTGLVASVQAEFDLNSVAGNTITRTFEGMDSVQTDTNTCVFCVAGRNASVLDYRTNFLNITVSGNSISGSLGKDLLERTANVSNLGQPSVIVLTEGNIVFSIAETTTAPSNHWLQYIYNPAWGQVAFKATAIVNDSNYGDKQAASLTRDQFMTSAVIASPDVTVYNSNSLTAINTVDIDTTTNGTVLLSRMDNSFVLAWYSLNTAKILNGAK